MKSIISIVALHYLMLQTLGSPDSSAMCQQPASWTIDGNHIMSQYIGNVTVVILIDASRTMNLFFAQKYQQLYGAFIESNYHKLSFVFINSKNHLSVANKMVLEEVINGLDLYQETNSETVFNTLNGDRLDMFVYNRCGQLSRYIPHPSTLKVKKSVIPAILTVYHDDPCGAWCLKSSSPRMDYSDKQEVSLKWSY